MRIGRFHLAVYAAAVAMLLLWPLRAYASGTGGLLALILCGVVVFVVAFRMFRVLGPTEKMLIDRVHPRAWDWLTPILVGRGRRDT